MIFRARMWHKGSLLTYLLTYVERRGKARHRRKLLAGRGLALWGPRSSSKPLGIERGLKGIAGFYMANVTQRKHPKESLERWRCSMGTVEQTQAVRQAFKPSRRRDMPLQSCRLEGCHPGPRDVMHELHGAN